MQVDTDSISSAHIIPPSIALLGGIGSTDTLTAVWNGGIEYVKVWDDTTLIHHVRMADAVEPFATFTDAASADTLRLTVQRRGLYRRWWIGHGCRSPQTTTLRSPTMPC